MTNVTYQPPPPTPPRSVGPWAWFHDRFTWPIVATAAFSAIGLCYAQLPSIDPCRDQARPVVEAGEIAYLRGSIEEADGLAAEALTLAPACGCAHLLAGRIRHAQMLAATRAGDSGHARAARLDCLRHLIFVDKPNGGNPEVAALMKACRVPAPVQAWVSTAPAVI